MTHISTEFFVVNVTLLFNEKVLEPFVRKFTKPTRGIVGDKKMTTIDIDSSSWDERVLGSSLPVIVDFWAPWCPWCRRLMPDFDSLSGDYAGRLVFAKVNADESPDIATKYGVQGLPTLKFFCASRPIAEIVGYLPRNSLKMQLDDMLSMYKDCLEQSSAMKEHV